MHRRNAIRTLAASSAAAALSLAPGKRTTPAPDQTAPALWIQHPENPEAVVVIDLESAEALGVPPGARVINNGVLYLGGGWCTRWITYHHNGAQQTRQINRRVDHFKPGRAAR